jgi:hypothetical protein
MLMKLTKSTLQQLIKELFTEQVGRQALDLYSKAIQSAQKGKKSRNCPTKGLIRRLLDPKTEGWGEKGLQLDLLFDGLEMQYKNCDKRRLKRLKRYAKRYQRILKYRQRMADKRKGVGGGEKERVRVNSLCFGQGAKVIFRIEGKVVRSLNDALKNPAFRGTQCPASPEMNYGHWSDARGALYRGKSIEIVRALLPPGVWEGKPAEHHKRMPTGAQEVEVPPLRVENGVPVCSEGARMREDTEGRKVCYEYKHVLMRKCNQQNDKQACAALAATVKGSSAVITRPEAGPDEPHREVVPSNVKENTTYSSFPPQQKLFENLRNYTESE